MSKSSCEEPLPSDLAEHRAVRAWRQLAPESSAPEKIEFLKLKMKCAAYRLTRVAADGSTIIAKRCVARTASVEQMIYEDFLPRVPVPAVRFHGVVREPEGDYWWLFLEDAGAGAYVPTRVEHRALAGRWLGAVHTAAMKAGLEDRLPNREPSHYLKLLQSSRAAMREHFSNPFLPLDDTRMLRSLAADCDLLESRWHEVESICSRFPRTIVHGDLVIKNVRVRRDPDGPAFLVFDWENAGWGVPGTDLAQATGRTVSPDLEAYGSASRELLTDADRGALRRLAGVGRYFRLLDDINWEIPRLAFRPYEYLFKAVSRLRVYRLQLQEALQESGWAS